MIVFISLTVLRFLDPLWSMINVNKIINAYNIGNKLVQK